MHASQTPSRAKTVGSGVALWLFLSLALGAVLAFIGSLILHEHNLGGVFTSFALVPLFLVLTSSHRRASLRPAWRIVLPLIGFYLIVVVSFFWSLPLASNLSGLFLMLLIIAIIAQRIQFSSMPGWLLALGCGLAGGAGAALVCGLMLGPGMMSLSLMELLVESTGLAGLVGWMLRQALDHFWPHMNQGQAAAMPAPAPAATNRTLSRRDVLQGLGGLASLAVTGVGFAALSRSLLAHVVPLVTYKSLGKPQSISWSPDSKRIVSATTLGVAIWEAATGGTIFDPHADLDLGYLAKEPAVWSPDGSRIAVQGSSFDDSVGNSDQNVFIVDAVTMRSLVTVSAGRSGRNSEVSAIAWSPDGARIATASGETQVWDAVTGKLLHTLKTGLFVASWSPDGLYLVTDNNDMDNDSQVQVWNAESDILLSSFHGHTNFIQAVAWSPDSTKIASASFDNTVQVWEALTGKHLLTYPADPYGVNAVAWSPDGTRIASAGVSQDVHVWNAATGELVFLYKGHTEQVNALAWSPDGTHIASGSDDETVQIWQPF